MRQHWIIKIIVGVALGILFSATALGQGVSLPNLAGGDSSEQPEVSNEEFQQSLNDVISMLENEEQRTALLASLRELQVSTSATEDDGVVRQGLLGALADTLTDIGEQAQADNAHQDQNDP